MLEDLKTLVELQKVDSELLALDRAKGDLPSRVLELKGQLEQISALRNQTAEALAAAQKDRRAAEGALQMAKERKRKYDEQLYTVRNNKEYDAVTAEIEMAVSDIDDSETRILEAIEREEGLIKAVAEQDERLAAVQTEFVAQQAILAKREAETGSMVASLATQREGLVLKLRRQILGAYQRILNGKDGLAVVSVVRGACGGCSTRIPPQRVMEIREMSQIRYCESCGRILVWNDTEEDAGNKSEPVDAAVAV